MDCEATVTTNETNSKRMWFLPLSICAILCCTTLTACGDDDKDQPIESGTQNADAKKFIGTWHSGAKSGGTWTFNADGTCKFSNNSSNH